MSDIPVSGAGGGNRDRLVDAFLALLAEQPFERIGLGDVARRAGLTLSQLRQEFSSVMAILPAHVKRVDAQVLEGDTADMADETPREKLFDLLMRRLEILAPHKAAMRSLMRSAARNPGLALALNGLAVRSQQWMLTAADIGTSGPKGMMRAQAMAVLFACVMRVWVNDEDPGLARTMAALDRELARAGRWSGFLDDLCAIPEAACRARDRFRARRRGARDRDDEEPLVA
jgi:AcrR family transcriptional regulator